MSILIFILVLSILIIVHEFGHFVVARRTGVRVEQFSLGFGPQILGWKRAGTQYNICIIPLGGYVKLAGDNAEEFQGKPDEYLAKSVGQRARIVVYGPLLNYILAFVCFWFIFFVGFPNLTCRVGELVEDFGAQQAGVLAGDEILAVDGQEVKVWQDLQKFIHNKAEGEVVRLSILRNNQQLEIPVSIKQEEMDGPWGETKSIGLIGIKPSEEFVTIRYGLLKSFFMGAQRLLYLTWATLKQLAWLVSGRVSFRQSVTGPLGIFYITQEAASLGLIPLMQVVAVVSMSLAIFNLLPLPVLDGGHLLFLLIEKIRKRRLSARSERIITQAGLSLILLLVIFVFYNDLLRYGVFDKISEWWGR
jgi:regulator of sigma E protease